MKICNSKYFHSSHINIKGWSAVPEEKASRYRLSIKDVQMQDSGTYTCASPRGLTNSITIVVAGKTINVDYLCKCLSINLNPFSAVYFYRYVLI